MTFKEIVGSINRRGASNGIDLLIRCRFPLRYVGGGRYRNVYEIIGTNYLVKVPIQQLGKKRIADASLAHARAEYETYRRIKESKSRYKELQPYLIDKFAMTRGGIIVVERLNKVGRGSTKQMEAIAKRAGELMGRYCDLHDSNFMLDRYGRLKIVDLGYFLPNKNFKKES